MTTAQDLTDLKISKALALAIGWKRAYIVEIHMVSESWLQVGGRVFDYRHWHVIGPIAERYNCFPFTRSARLWWSVFNHGSHFSATPQKAIAMAGIEACFHAAEVEGLPEVLANTADGRLKDLVERRLMYALEFAAGASPVTPQCSVPPVFASQALGNLTASGIPETIDQFQLALNSAFVAGKVVGAFPVEPTQARELSDENERLRVALRFYANGEHYHLDEDEEFDTVSGEPANWLHSGREDSATSIEDGSVARFTLLGKTIPWVDGDEDCTPARIAGEPVIAAINTKGGAA